MTFELPYWSNFAAMVSIYAQDGSVAVSHVGIEMGQGINTKVSLVGIDASKNINRGVVICTFASVRDSYFHMHAYIHIHTYIHTYMHAYTHARAHTHTHTQCGL
jgi:hypothetical protein